ncbi:hypothetical protein K8R33_05245, partial [archaeon]|nr:hypothetical protein [archaeon]
AKKALIKIALENSKESKKGLDKLEKYLEKAMPALIFTSEDAFKIAKRLDRNKSSSLAKPGQIAPKDIMVPEGPTPFAPGPIIGELGQAGIKAAIEDGKVVIKEPAAIVKKGEEISQKQADLLAKFGVEPMEIGLNIVAVYQDGEIFEAEILSVDEEEYLEKIKTAVAQALNLAVYSAYPTKETIEILLQKAERESIALESKLPKTTGPKTEEKPTTEEQPKAEEKPVEEAPKEEVQEEKKEETKEEPQKEEEPKPEETKEEVSEIKKDIQKESTEMNQVVYSEESEKKAQELINKLKDQDIGG